MIGLDISRARAALVRERVRVVPLSLELPGETRVVKVDKEDVPKEFREDKKADGKVLTSTYLIKNPQWSINYSKELSVAHKDGRLTRRIKVGHGFAYLHDELAGMWRIDSKKDG